MPVPPDGLALSSRGLPSDQDEEKVPSEEEAKDLLGGLGNITVQDHTPPHPAADFQSSQDGDVFLGQGHEVEHPDANETAGSYETDTAQPQDGQHKTGFPESGLEDGELDPDEDELPPLRSPETDTTQEDEEWNIGNFWDGPTREWDYIGEGPDGPDGHENPAIQEPAVYYPPWEYLRSSPLRPGPRPLPHPRTSVLHFDPSSSQLANERTESQQQRSDARMFVWAGRQQGLFDALPDEAVRAGWVPGDGHKVVARAILFGGRTMDWAAGWRSIEGIMGAEEWDDRVERVLMAEAERDRAESSP